MSQHGSKRPVRALALAGLLVGTLAFTACSSSSPADPGSEAQPAEVLTLEFWNGLTGTDKASVDELVADFNESQSAIEVISTAMPWDVLKQKLLSSITSGSGPDLVSIDTADLAQFVEAGALQPLDDFYGSGLVDDENLVTAAVEATRLGDSRYGIPLNFFTSMLYWNKDLFAAAGYDHPPTTWAEFEEMAQELTVDEDGDGTPEQYAIALADHDTVPMFQPLLWNTGGGVVSDDGTTALLDDPATLEALQFWVDQVVTHKVSPVGMSGPDADALFQSGKAAMEIVGPWLAPTFEEAGIDFGVARTPAGPEAQYSLAGTVAFTVPASVEGPSRDAAFEFAAFWNGRDQQAKFSSQTGFPSTRTDITAEDVSDNPYPAIFGDPAVTSQAKVFLAGVHNGAQINTTVFVPALQRALNGQGTVESLFTAAQSEAQSLLDN